MMAAITTALYMKAVCYYYCLGWICFLYLWAVCLSVYPSRCLSQAVPVPVVAFLAGYV